VIAAPPRTILLATDFSEASTAAFAQAMRFARAEGARLLIAHAFQERSLPSLGYASMPAFEQWNGELRQLAEKNLSWLIGRARAEGVAVEPLLLEGFPDEAIVEAARAHHADLVVLGTHGRRGAARFFLGSVAGRVAAMAPCPVLTVGPKACGK
jgi:nucleotide-binding universal stress UspA family protein